MSAHSYGFGGVGALELYPEALSLKFLMGEAGVVVGSWWFPLYI